MVLISVLKLLYDGKLHTSKEIEEKFEVSRATVKRIIGVLRDENIKIITIELISNILMKLKILFVFC